MAQTDEQKAAAAAEKAAAAAAKAAAKEQAKAEAQAKNQFVVGDKTYELTRTTPVLIDRKTVTAQMILASQELQEQLVAMNYGHIREVIS
jgi:hypothetical protein